MFAIELEDLITPFVAVFAAFFGYWFHERLRRQQYLSELREWSSFCLDSLSEAVHLCDLEPSSTSNPDFFNRRHSILVKLSSQIDQGRWFFPNIEPMGVDAWRLESYSSLKQRPLDDLVYAYGAVRRMSYTDKQENVLLRAPMVEIKKDFTLSIQSLLDPKKVHKQLGLLNNK